MNKDAEKSRKEVSRRDIFKLSWAALGGFVALEMGALSLGYMQPRLAEGEFGSLIAAGKVDDFPPGSVTHIPDGRCYLVRLEDGGFLALYQRCTHLGCSVPWDQDAGQFICPCHSSSFSIEGDVLTPPAPRPLDTFTVEIRAGQVWVDTSNPLERNHFVPDQVVYAS